MLHFRHDRLARHRVLQRSHRPQPGAAALDLRHHQAGSEYQLPDRRDLDLVRDGFRQPWSLVFGRSQQRLLSALADPGLPGLEKRAEDDQATGKSRIGQLAIDYCLLLFRVGRLFTHNLCYCRESGQIIAHTFKSFGYLV